MKEMQAILLSEVKQINANPNETLNVIFNDGSILFPEYVEFDSLGNILIPIK